jgi:hypothetical protein
MPRSGTARSPHPIEQLAAWSKVFGPGRAAAKLQLLQEITGLRRVSMRRLRLLHDTVYVMLAYPDSPAVLRQVQELIVLLREWIAAHPSDPPAASGMPGSRNRYSYSYETVVHLTRLFPRCLEFDWEEIQDASPVVDAIRPCLGPTEVDALDADDIPLAAWLDHARTHEEQTDLELVLQLLGASSLDLQQRAEVYEATDLPVVYDLRQPGSSRAEIRRAPRRVHYQRLPIPRERYDLRPRLRRPLPRTRPVPATRGQALIELAVRALATRNLEIQPLLDASPEAVTVVPAGKGIQVVLVGVRPPQRAVLEGLFFFTVLKNGVPIAYGPLGSFLGAGELGINLFPEFRGGEIWHIYAQVFRAFYHLASVRYFFLTPYGMGQGNDEALQSGAFWFYRKLGFRPTNPAVEQLARTEEARMARHRGYRSDLAMLRRLSDTAAALDLSGGRCRPLDFTAIGLAVSRMMAERFGGDRILGEASCLRHLRRTLDLRSLRGWSPDEREALRRLAPVLCLIEDLPEWPRAHRHSLIGLIRTRGHRTERAYLHRALTHPRLAAALHAVT